MKFKGDGNGIVLSIQLNSYSFENYYLQFVNECSKTEKIKLLSQESPAYKCEPKSVDTKPEHLHCLPWII